MCVPNFNIYLFLKIYIYISNLFLFKMVELKKKSESAESSRDNAEEELKKALRLIEQLRQQNADLQEQIARLEKAKKKLSEEVVIFYKMF